MEVSTAAVSGARATRVRPDRGLRVIRIGVLGLGNVGQAVVRAAAASAGPLRRRGIAIAIECALVRDVSRARRCPKVARVTNNVEAFMRGRYDAVIDALAGAEPAGAIAGRLLGKGVPVVSANKALIAAEGPRLRGVAARGGTSLRIEASVMAGVPFLGAFERRPLAASATQFAGIVNGTSHFVLSRIAEGAAFETALAEAQALGYAEPDPAADIDGIDASQKLAVLAGVLLDAFVHAPAIAPVTIAGITPDDFAAARSLGGTIKPIVLAARRAGGGLTAFAGPAWIPASHPLASVTGRDNIIAIDSRFSGRLVFAGPGAGPDVTAATLLDDAIEAAGARGERPRPEIPGFAHTPVARVHAPETGWFIRVSGAEAQLIPQASAEHLAAIAAAHRASGRTVRAWRAIVD